MRPPAVRDSGRDVRATDSAAWTTRGPKNMSAFGNDEYLRAFDEPRALPMSALIASFAARGVRFELVADGGLTRLER